MTRWRQVLPVPRHRAELPTAGVTLSVGARHQLRQRGADAERAGGGGGGGVRWRRATRCTRACSAAARRAKRGRRSVSCRGKSMRTSPRRW
ncbi:hypothetical protein M8494_31300 [Serratia ureilytica]